MRPRTLPVFMTFFVMCVGVAMGPMALLGVVACGFGLPCMAIVALALRTAA